jgi:hypothetical protein
MGVMGGDAGVLASGTTWGDFHRVFLGAGEREDLVQCHRCYRIVADEERTAHLRWHKFDDKHRRCEVHNAARYWCGCWSPDRG